VTSSEAAARRPTRRVNRGDAFDRHAEQLINGGYRSLKSFD
jgi:hypothetical protein